MMKVLFVCTGNICRSPMAEGLLKKMRPDLEVASAGISALVGWGASSEAVKVMTDYGIDISGHRARQVDEGVIQEADLVLGMTRRHREWMMKRFPQGDGKILTLKEYAGMEGDIKNPYGGPGSSSRWWPGRSNRY